MGGYGSFWSWEKYSLIFLWYWGGSIALIFFWLVATFMNVLMGKIDKTSGSLFVNGVKEDMRV